MQAQIRKNEEEAARMKKLVNQICQFAGMPLPYADAELEVAAGAGLAVRRNSFFGRPLTTVVREYLEMRQRAGSGAAKLNEIMDALKEGGYDLSTVSAKGDGEQRRGVAISLAKNSTTFVRLPTGDYGLVDWYPNIKRRKAAENGRGESVENGSLAPEETQPTDGEVLPPESAPAPSAEAPAAAEEIEGGAKA